MPTSAETRFRIVSALAAADAFGLYPAANFRLADGRCRDCPTIRQALWYFRDETIAVPKADVPIASYTRGVRFVDDVRSWIAQRSEAGGFEHPPLVWVAAPEVVDGARLAFATATLEHAAGSLPFELVPKIALNRSYFDASSARFFGERRVRLRGRLDEGKLVARTLWPEDFRLDAELPPRALGSGLSSAEALRTLIRADPMGGAREPYRAWSLWRRDPTSAAVPPGRAVVGLIVNGAQGDDDEAHGGHFALVTGRTRPDGAIGDWLVNNFYSLDSLSEKGILAAPVPLDNYLADLNSGQNWYRPSHMLVAVLATDSAPALIQGAMNRVYNQFWRHQLVYRHATMNCASISVDVLRALGLDVPSRGPASRLLAMLGFPWLVLKERTIDKAKIAFDYLSEDQTRLLPAVAYEDVGASLVELAMRTSNARDGLLARILARDLESLAFIRFPQFPSSRAFGTFAVVTPREYRARMPADPGQARIVPVPPRPFPDALRDADLLPATRPASDYAAMIWGTLLVVGIPLFIYRTCKRWLERRARSRSSAAA